MSIILKTQNISKDFISGEDTSRVLHNISIDIHTNKLTMLVGPSGCGKTTLISIMSGILTPSEGKVYIDGVDIELLSDDKKTKLRRERIGFIFQQYNLLPSLTAAENAAIPLIANGMDIKKASEKSLKIFEHIGMLEHANKTPNKLSGGQQQRVAIARALIHKPDIIICDEPTAALDAQTGMQIMSILKKISQGHNHAVLIVTHDNRIFEFADSKITMSDGKIINYD